MSSLREKLVKTYLFQEYVFGIFAQIPYLLHHPPIRGLSGVLVYLIVAASGLCIRSRQKSIMYYVLSQYLLSGDISRETPNVELVHPTTLTNLDGFIGEALH